MAVTGRGDFPFRTTWPLRRRLGSLSPFLKAVHASDEDFAEVTAFNDWFFPASGPANYQFTCSGGSYALSGQSATLLRSKVLVASGGAYTLTGQSAIISRNCNLTASGGSYALTGAAAGINRNRVLTAQGGTYTYSGQQVTITYTPGSVNYQFTCQGGAYALAGQSAVLTRSRVLVAQGGSYALTGQSANLYRNRKLTAQGGTYVITGSQVSFLYTGSVWPLPTQVAAGVVYGPHGNDYTGTYVDTSVKLDLETSRLFKPLTSKTGVLL